MGPIHRLMSFFAMLTAASLLKSTAAIAETRLALVISNANYGDEIGRLVNPHKDSAAIAAALRDVDFANANITIMNDVNQAAFRLAIADFVEKIEMAGPDAVAFFYYSGHGAADRTERGENYLIPTGARISLAKQLPVLGVSLSEITKALERVPAKARFVVIDACRNVAFSGGLKDLVKGFVPERKLDGMIVAFATRPGETANDNNIYASTLASFIRTPGLEAEQVFKETQRRVFMSSSGRQMPWIEDGLLNRFRFREAAVGLAVRREATRTVHLRMNNDRAPPSDPPFGAPEAALQWLPPTVVAPPGFLSLFWDATEDWSTKLQHPDVVATLLYLEALTPGERSTKFRGSALTDMANLAKGTNFRSSFAMQLTRVRADKIRLNFEFKARDVSGLPARAIVGNGHGYLPVLLSIPAAGKASADALAQYAEIRARYPGVLDGREPVLKEIDRGDKGVYYRVMAGPPGSKEQAYALCEQLKAQGYKDCWVFSVSGY